MKEDWRSLKVGDRIRIVRLPTPGSMGGCILPADTRRVYERLIARNKPLVIHEVDDLGHPWIKFTFRSGSGGFDYHYLAINDDSWVRVRTRKRR